MPENGLDDPHYADFAWRRFRRLMIWMVLASALASVIGLYALSRMIGPLPIHMVIAAGGGVFAAVLLAATLMGLVFLSAGSGHDDTIHEPFDEERP